jgi:putative ABC transport system substrate-binding protein
LVRLNVDVIIVAGGDVWIRAARTATSETPIVMTGGGLDPIAAGHVQSLGRPGGNVTGLTILNTELTGKRLELLKEAVPKLNRVAVLHDPAIPSNVQELKDLQTAARPLKLIIQAWELRDASGLDKVFAALGKERPDGLYICQGGILNNSRNSIAVFALKSRLPSIHSAREFADGGGMMTYGADRAASYRRVAYFIDRILKGAKPGDLPVEQPTKFELIINLKTAKQIALTIPPNLLARADRVIR